MSNRLLLVKHWLFLYASTLTDPLAGPFPFFRQGDRDSYVLVNSRFVCLVAHTVSNSVDVLGAELMKHEAEMIAACGHLAELDW